MIIIKMDIVLRSLSEVENDIHLKDYFEFIKQRTIN